MNEDARLDLEEKLKIANIKIVERDQEIKFLLITITRYLRKVDKQDMPTEISQNIQKERKELDYLLLLHA
jgi:hypothetical protein